MATIERRGAAWRARVRLAGVNLTATRDTEADARQWAEATEARLRAGQSVQQIVTMPDSLTVRQLLDRYADEVSPSKGGARWEQIRLRKIAKELPVRVAELDAAMLAEWRNARLKQVSASSVNRELNLISAVFTHAIKEWRLPMSVNPAHGIKWPKKPEPRRRRVSDDERAAIMAALGWDGMTAPVLTKQWVAWSFALALETMMRQGEILKLTWRHVHARHCHLPRTKNGTARDVPLSRVAVGLFTMLDQGADDNAVVPVDAGTLGVYFRRACRAAGVEDLHFHDARREALTRAAKKLTNPLELARASGHKGIGVLMGYYRPDVGELADKLD